LKPLLISREGAFLLREGVKAMDMESGMGDAEMGRQRKIFMKHDLTS
jgi:hypothetical protein